ncbi:MAG: LamG-like jellyroll fold domain-containing protein [Asticcacaulis sp.]
MPIDRRAFISGTTAIAGGLSACAGLPMTAPSLPQLDWRFDNLRSIGGEATHIEGRPQLIDAPGGKAVLFDGVLDAIFIDRHPLAGAKTFAFEAIFRPDGGAFEQRWFYLDETDPPPPDGSKPLDPHFTFEIRATPDTWYLDAYTVGHGYKQTLIVPNRQYPLGRWHHVAQTYNGKTYRSFVNGELQGAADIAYAPQGPGRSCAGTRINRVNYFRGAIARARFTPWFLPPEKFITMV